MGARAAAGREPMVPEPIVLDGYLPPAGLSPNASRNLPAGMRLRLKREMAALVYARVRAAGWPAQPMDGPRRRLTITMFRPRLMDDDNATAAWKAGVDAVKAAGALHDDRPRYAEIVVRQEKAPGKVKRTVLELEELAA